MYYKVNPREQITKPKTGKPEGRNILHSKDLSNLTKLISRLLTLLARLPCVGPCQRSAQASNWSIPRPREFAITGWLKLNGFHGNRHRINYHASINTDIQVIAVRSTLHCDFGLRVEHPRSPYQSIRFTYSTHSSRHWSFLRIGISWATLHNSDHLFIRLW